MKQLRNRHLRATFHWLLASLIVAMLAIGFVWLRPMPNADPHKIRILALHAGCGVLIAVLLLARLSVRLPAADLAERRKKAALFHGLLYGLIGLILVTGLATALAAHLPTVFLHGTVADLPRRFTSLPAFIAHTLLVELLTLLIVVHVASALFHQFILKDRLLSSMFYRAPDDWLAASDG